MATREQEVEAETRRLRGFQAEVDELCRLITGSDLPWIDVELRIEALRRQAVDLFPGTHRVFELVYDARFRRLRQQWRTAGPAPSQDR